eukprot:TRINITY_DN1135_c0_g3_i1.p2 TRINITY_DN1135_c0_g3~~TRINITY_DN1135_c0_g3_i1.p2  ORF type:complete len:296 (-),score=83.56 TRINITY_DN1135_c0_g3_i1:1414-2301(-)
MSPLPFEETTALPRIGETTTMATGTAGKMLPSISELLQHHHYHHQEQAEQPVTFIGNHFNANTNNSLTETLERLADAVLKHEEQRLQLQLQLQLQAAIAMKTMSMVSLVQQDTVAIPSDSKANTKKTTTSTPKSRNNSKTQTLQTKKSSLKKKALRKSPELEWAQQKARVLSIEEIRKLKLVFMEKQKTMNKMSGMKMTDISSHYIFQHGNKHDHSNFAKWLKNNRGRNGRGGTNLLLLLIWFRLSHGEDFEKMIRDIPATPAADQKASTRPQELVAVSSESIPLMTISMDTTQA